MSQDVQSRSVNLCHFSNYLAHMLVALHCLLGEAKSDPLVTELTGLVGSGLGFLCRKYATTTTGSWLNIQIC